MKYLVLYVVMIFIMITIPALLLVQSTKQEVNQLLNHANHTQWRTQ